MKNLSDLNRAVKDTSNPNLEQAQTLFDHVDQCYTDLIKMINSKKKKLTVDDEIEEMNEKCDLIKQQFDMARSALSSFEEQQITLALDLDRTSKKNLATRSKASVQSSINSRKSSHCSRSRLFCYEEMSPEEKIIVAESRLETAAIEVRLAKKLAAVRAYPSQNVDQTSKNNQNDVSDSPFPPSDEIVSRSNDVEYADTSSNINDTYLAGKMLVESGAKVQFDGNPKNFIAFSQGMERVMSMHGAKFSLIYDILQSRCTGKASEAIKFCDGIKDPQIAVRAALNRLKKYFGNEAAIVEDSISSITRNEMVKWNAESFQFFLNELENIKVLLDNDLHKKTINSPNVVKGIISRMPKRSRDELVKILCTSDQHLPSFQFLLEFVEKQLKLVSHPIANIVPMSETKSSESNRKFLQSATKNSTGRDSAHVRAFAQEISNVEKCPVIGCSQAGHHALWCCSKFLILNTRDKWAIAKRQKCCYKCLNNGHRSVECQSPHCCRICKSREHHYLLCPNGNNAEQKRSSKDLAAAKANCAHVKSDVKNLTEVSTFNVVHDVDKKLLPIIPVKIINAETNQCEIANCLLDSGSDATMINKRLVKLLKIKPKSDRSVRLCTSNAETACFLYCRCYITRHSLL